MRIRREHPIVKSKLSHCSNPSPEQLPSLWHELAILADVAPEGERAGLARKRTALLANIPAWRLPAVLDALSTQGEPA